MNISVNLEEGSTSCTIDFEQSDIENMWNYLMEDRENFEYIIVQYLNNNFDNFKDEWGNDLNFQELYNNLNQIYGME
jgi:CTP:phosphocholine cytidylyltransferase-like protein